MELQLQHLSKHYGTKYAVHDVSTTLSPGVYGLLGANGAGKTTLMRMLCGVLAPTFGRICLDGQSIEKLGEDYYAHLGYMPQDFGFYPDFTAREFMRYMAAVKGLDKKEVKDRTEELLKLVNLHHVADKKIKFFSGGMKQRLGIAQAELNSPDILILDEPTAGLDPKERVRFRNLISDFAKEKIVILSTHIVSDVSYIADTILMMKDGTFLLQEPMAAVTDCIRGKVWELLVSDREAAEYSSRFSVVNLHHENGKVRLRMIHETIPAADAITVQPSLEDLFLYYFGEEAGTERSESGYVSKI
ncbi:MAG: ABC transporter ATP-binding protein [Clostridia bacterium]|nr:ABC transporter ATP-binding protein [Clostridia bacterium]